MISTSTCIFKNTDLWCCNRYLSAVSGRTERRFELLLLLLVQLNEVLRPQGGASKSLAEDGVDGGRFEPKEPGKKKKIHQFRAINCGKKNCWAPLDRRRRTCTWGASRAAGWAPPPHTRMWWPRPPTGSRAWPPGGRRTARWWHGPDSGAACTACRCPSPWGSRPSADLQCSSLAPWGWEGMAKVQERTSWGKSIICRVKSGLLSL